eukprot:756579-Hanusia_phi.AAC.4
MASVSLVVCSQSGPWSLALHASISSPFTLLSPLAQMNDTAKREQSVLNYIELYSISNSHKLGVGRCNTRTEGKERGEQTQGLGRRGMNDGIKQQRQAGSRCGSKISHA